MLKPGIFLIPLWLAAVPALAQTPDAPPAAAPAQPCTDPATSADYVPGVDAYGRTVAPADVPGTSTIDVNSTVQAQIRTHNRAVPFVGVDVALNAPAPPHACPAAAPKMPR
jgi:hypothetical protein